MENTKRINKKYIIIAAVAVTLVAAILLTLILVDKKLGIFPDQGEGDGKVIEHDGVKYVLRDGVETFLVMGLDKALGDVSSDSYNNNQQADFLMLMVFDNNVKTYSMLHINRDTMVDIEVLGVAGNKVDTVRKQIALAHTYGNGGTVSNSNTARSVSKLLYGVKVNHYISFTLDSVAVMNDLVDGVTLEVLEDFTGIEGAEGLIKGETVTLTNEQALLYVQERQKLTDSTNATRMERQRQYIEAMRAEVTDRIKEDKSFFATALVKMADRMTSDCSTNRLEEIGEKMQNYEYVETADVEGESKVGETTHMEFYPDENSLKKTVIDLFYEPKK